MQEKQYNLCSWYTIPEQDAKMTFSIKKTFFILPK